MTGVPDACATGCAPAATAESVGPRIAATLSWSMNFLKTVMPWSRVEPSSSMISWIFWRPPWNPPVALNWSTASCAPFVCCGL